MFFWVKQAVWELPDIIKRQFFVFIWCVCRSTCIYIYTSCAGLWARPSGTRAHGLLWITKCGCFLRTKCGSFARAPRTISHWSISRVPIDITFEQHFLVKNSQFGPREAAGTWPKSMNMWPTCLKCVLLDSSALLVPRSWGDFSPGFKWTLGDPRSLYNGDYSVEVAHLVHRWLVDSVHQIPLDWDIWGPDTKR